MFASPMEEYKVRDTRVSVCERHRKGTKGGGGCGGAVAHCVGVADLLELELRAGIDSCLTRGQASNPR